MTHVRFALLIALFAAACVPASAPPTIEPAPSPTTQPSPTAQPSLTAQPSPIATPDPTDRVPALPPAARLTIPAGSTHPAALGSYSYDGAAADSPWLPARVLTPVNVAAGSSLELDVVPPEQFVRWSARYADAQDEAADVITRLASGGDGFTPMNTARFGAPPSGSWVLMVQLYFADEAGDAAYYWHLVVP